MAKKYDLFGKELNVGDRVVFMETRLKNYIVGTILELGKGKVKHKIQPDGSSYYIYNHHRVIKIGKDDKVCLN